mgnify:CR=1 FL=1
MRYCASGRGQRRPRAVGWRPSGRAVAARARVIDYDDSRFGRLPGIDLTYVRQDIKKQARSAIKAVVVEAGNVPHFALAEAGGDTILRGHPGHPVTALRNFANTSTTRRIVLGGFLGSLSRVRPDMFESITARSPIAGGGSGIEVVRAELGTSILMVGAAELAFASVLADPTAVGTAGRRAAGS